MKTKIIERNVVTELAAFELEMLKCMTYLLQRMNLSPAQFCLKYPQFKPKILASMMQGKQKITVDYFVKFSAIAGARWKLVETNEI